MGSCLIIESPHGHLKRRIKQSLDIRGSFDFESIDEYEQWLDSVVSSHNKRNAKKFKFERPHLQDLPAYKTTDFEEHVVCVSSSSTFKLKRVTYSVPSRLIGKKLRVLVYQRYIECYLGSTQVFTSERGRPVNKRRCRLIDYRHIIGSLVKKPQAFRHSQIRDDILPSEEYKMIWRHVDQAMDAKSACKFIVGIMYLSSNKSFSAWDEIFPDNMMAVAAIDRLVHHAKIYSIEGESYRRKHSISKENFKSENMLVNKEKSMLNSES
ncbi:ATP-binding protein [Francisellaceae bacterium]|nr:ATP-binding protein [Francisellaceae bacterium]